MQCFCGHVSWQIPAQMRRILSACEFGGATIITLQMSLTINHLPPEILAIIFHYLDSVTRRKVSRYVWWFHLKGNCSKS